MFGAAKIWGGLAIALAVAGVLTGAGLYIFNQGRAVERAAILQKSVDVLRERIETDDQVKNLSDAALCAALGGVLDIQGNCI